MKVSILYLNEDLRYFGDDEQNVITRYNFQIESGVREITDESLDVDKHYTEVKSFEVEDALYPDVNELLNELFHMYNMGVMPRIITQKVHAGEISGIDHSSMSVGDIIKVNDDMYIVEGIGFRKLELN
jgi:hypothetical protein